jgi:hypothetical protein
VFCDSCRFDFLTMEGNPPCSDPMICEHGEEAKSHVENVREWMRVRGAAGLRARSGDRDGRFDGSVRSSVGQ